MNSHNFVAPAGNLWDMANIPIMDTAFDSPGTIQHPSQTGYGGLSAPSTNPPPAFDLGSDGTRLSSVAISSQARVLGKRRRYDNLDWNAHQDELRQLYLLENKTLDETMKVMEEKHSFIASKKLYKNQFKKWGWNKNLPVTHSRFMVDKADARNRENKETVFLFGGQKWDREAAQASLSRNKRAQTYEDGQDYPTPAGVSYKTPINYAASEAEDLIESGASDVDADSDVLMAGDLETASRGSVQLSSDESSDEDSIHPGQTNHLVDAGNLCINSNGLTRNDLLEVFEMARSRKAEGKTDEADELFLQAIQGFDEVMGPTHAETKRVKYECINFYAEARRMRDADAMLDELTRAHITTWGYEHKRTQQHLLHTVELLENWGRSDDALGLLSSSKEIVESLQHKKQCGLKTALRGARRCDRDTHGVEAIAEEIAQDGSLAKVEYGLGLAKSHAKANDEAAGNLLRAIIRHCDSHPNGLAVQHLHAFAELLSSEKRLERTATFALTVTNAEETFKKVWRDYDWDEEKFQCIELMEAAMQLAFNLLKAGYRPISTRIFRKVDEKARDLFGNDDERTIWILITIGLAYQNQTTWRDAEEWFEGAFAAALASNKWSGDDGIVRSLQNAMDKRHFSYSSDEGRPYKTIFGISGISIRPGRLHLE